VIRKEGGKVAKRGLAKKRASFLGVRRELLGRRHKKVTLGIKKSWGPRADKRETDKVFVAGKEIR